MRSIMYVRGLEYCSVRFSSIAQSHFKLDCDGIKASPKTLEKT